MKFIELLPYLNNEEKAEEYLIEVGILKKFETCIYCDSSSLGKIRRGKIKCYSCKREWNRRKGSIIEGSSINLIKFIFFLKLFAYDITSLIISKEILVSNNKIIELKQTIRHRMFHSFLMNNVKNTFLKIDDTIYLYLHDDVKIKLATNDFHINQNEKYLVINFSRKRDHNSDYYYKYQMTFPEKGSKKTNELHWFWSTYKNHLKNYKGRNVESMYLFLIEKVYRFNCREGNIYKEIISLIRVA